MALFFAIRPFDIGEAADHVGTGAETFASRVELAKDAERQAAFVGYHAKIDRALGDQYATAMRNCVTGNAGRATEAFTLVADIARDGRARAVAVQPETQIASCFAKRVSILRFPAPPRYPGRSGFPLTVTMRIVP